MSIRRIHSVPAAFAVRLVLVLTGLLAASAVAAESYNEEPIDYEKATPSDAVARLQQRIDNGDAKLDFQSGRGYLDAVLRELKVLPTSQTLVFSKTSFQRDRISPKTPRALYFNDDVYVGFCRGGEVVEVAATDPRLGTTFYTLDQRKTDRPKFVRQTDNCLQCHAGSMTRDIPRLLLRSVFPDRRGQPILSAGTFVVTQETPMHDRWGGWYVTGTHGSQRHMGNVTVKDEDDVDQFDRDRGANVTSLADKFDPDGYLRDTSDIAALMVLEHQTEAHNRFTRAGYGVRLALRDEKVMNEALGRPADYRSDSTKSRIKSSCEPLVKYLLFSGEAKLTEPIRGTTTFAAEYAAQGPRDAKGRSLRDLDLQTRLLKYPCSPLIYSIAFEGLPVPAKEYVLHRLYEVLSGRDQSKDYAHLSADDRKAVLEIIRDTVPNLTKEWGSAR